MAALGLVSGLLSAAALALAEWIGLQMGESSLGGVGDTVRYLATATATYGAATVPLGFGFGLALSGLGRWLRPGDAWQKLRVDRAHRERVETGLAALIVWIPLFIGLLGAAGFLVERAFVRNMNNPTLASSFMGLSMVVVAFVLILFSGVAVVVIGTILPRIGMARLFKREPRLLKGTILLVSVGLVAAALLAFRAVYNPVVWPPSWMALLAATVVLPTALTVSGPVIGWARRARSLPAMALLLGGYLALSAWTFTGLEGWDGPRQALLGESRFAPALASLVQRLTDLDGDGYSALLGGGDCDDSAAEISPAAREVPGNGIDDNCIGGDATPRTAGGAPAEGTGTGFVAGNLAEGTGEGTGAHLEIEPMEPTPEPVPPPRNIVVLLVDTLRPDHLGFYGYERPLSPRMDEIARASVAFDTTYAQAPHTPRSIPSLFTSRYAGHIDFRGPTWNYPLLRDGNLTLFEVLDEMGYFNLAVTSHYYFEERRGMGQGFDEWDNRGALTIAETNEVREVAPDIFAHLEEHIPTLVASETPWCLFVHYFEPHGSWVWHPDSVDYELGERGRQRHIDRYDSEIAFVDDYVGRTVDLLESAGLLEDTLVVLTSDHGEAFDEHGHYFHGQTLYNEVLRVPLFFHAPGMAPHRVDTPVSLLDVAPTILALIGADIPPEFEGRPILGDGADLAPRPIFSELLPYSNYREHLVALITDAMKLIYDAGSRRWELYDLGVDPGEQESLHRDTERRAPYQAILIEWMEQ